MGDVLALDVSNYDGDITALLDAHPEVQRVVVRCSLEREALRAITRQQCATVRARGLGLDVYPWAYFRGDPDPASWAARCYDLVGPWAPDWYWPDCEDEDGWAFADPAANRDWLHRALEGFRRGGLRHGIYTGRWWWIKPYRMNNTTEFSDLPLWNATDTKVPDRTRGWPYGGWTPPYAGVQYDLSGPDRDCFDSALYAEAPVPDVSDDTAAQLSYLSALTHDILPQCIAELEAIRGKGQADQAAIDRVLTALRPLVS